MFKDIIYFNRAKAMFYGFASYNNLDDAMEKSIPFEVSYGDPSISSRALYMIILMWAIRHKYTIRTCAPLDIKTNMRDIDRTKKELYIVWVHGAVWDRLDDIRKAIHTSIPNHVIYLSFCEGNVNIDNKVLSMR